MADVEEEFAIEEGRYRSLPQLIQNEGGQANKAAVRASTNYAMWCVKKGGFYMRWHVAKKIWQFYEIDEVWKNQWGSRSTLATTMQRDGKEANPAGATNIEPDPTEVPETAEAEVPAKAEAGKAEADGATEDTPDESTNAAAAAKATAQAAAAAKAKAQAAAKAKGAGKAGAKTGAKAGGKAKAKAELMTIMEAHHIPFRSHLHEGDVW